MTGKSLPDMKDDADPFLLMSKTEIDALMQAGGALWSNQHQCYVHRLTGVQIYGRMPTDEELNQWAGGLCGIEMDVVPARRILEGRKPWNPCWEHAHAARVVEAVFKAGRKRELMELLWVWERPKQDQEPTLDDLLPNTHPRRFVLAAYWTMWAP